LFLLLLLLVLVLVCVCECVCARVCVCSVFDTTFWYNLAIFSIPPSDKNSDSNDFIMYSNAVKTL
jgi:hypothetical protein